LANTERSSTTPGRRASRAALALSIGALFAGAGPGAPVRHAPIEPATLRALLSGGQQARVIEGEGGAGALPEALDYAGQRLERPRRGDAPPAPEVVLGPEGRAARSDVIERPDRMRPDGETGDVAPLSYHGVFNPEVTPMRRNVAFDVVGPAPVYEFSIADPSPRAVAVASFASTAGRAPFFADMRVEVKPGLGAPLPSVAPDMRILALETIPSAASIGARIARDSADNFYLVAEQAASVHVMLFVDADAAYFDGPLPSNVPLEASRGDEDTALDAQTQTAAERVLEQIGIDPAGPFNVELGRLVAYFRDFESAGQVVDGDLYAEIALGQRGVCRHRAFAFVVTARAAGVPARYVQNEAHAFAEIRLPDGGWRRVDLGGQAPRLETPRAADRALHQPRPDAFPKPNRYLSQPGQAPAPLDSASPGAGAAPPPDAPETPPVGGQATSPGARTTEAPRVSARRITLTLDQSFTGPQPAFRGESAGQGFSGTCVDDRGVAVEGALIQAYLDPIGGGAGATVGVPATTDASGRFSLAVPVPPATPLGRYRIRLEVTAPDPPPR